MNRLAVGAVVDLRDNGKRLQPGQIYSYTKPPFLGGQYAFKNIEPCDISVHFSILGQLAERVKDLRRDAVSEIRIADRPAS